VRVVSILAAAAGLGAVIGLMPSCSTPRFSEGRSGATIEGCRVTDGDTIRCGDERVRLLGIDAPELPGHCRAGRICAPGDPNVSSAILGEAMASPMRIDRVGNDRYGRTLATVAGPRGDLSCWQLRHHAAIYKPTWDNGGRVAALCGDAAR
jgi:micrococcal nuclease